MTTNYTPPTPQSLTEAETQVENALGALAILLALLPVIFGASFVSDQKANAEHWGRDLFKAVKQLVSNGMFLFNDVFGQMEANISQLVGTDMVPFLKYAGTKWNGLVNDTLNAQRANLLAKKTIDPAKWESVASDALLEASLLGVGSRLVTGLFELILPKQLNTFNWLGPLMANWAGYDQIIGLGREPILRNAIGRLAEYQANADFPTRLPDEADAIEWNSRGLLKPGQLEEIFKYSGLRVDYEGAFTQSAYRALSAFIVIDLIRGGTITKDGITQLLTFAGVRPQDQAIVQEYADYIVPNPQRTTALSAMLTAAERGTIPDDQIDSNLHALEIPQSAWGYVHLAVGWRRLEQLAEIYRKSVSEGYLLGTVADADYVSDLEAIGIETADAEAHYAVDSIKKHGKEAVKAAREAAKLSTQRMREAVKAAFAKYQARQISAAELTLALDAAGLDPEIGASAVEVQKLKRRGRDRYVFGLWLDPAGAVDLREQISALEDQYKKQLIGDPQAAAGLVQLGIPEPNRDALLATWAAMKTKPTTTGEKLPR